MATALMIGSIPGALANSNELQLFGSTSGAAVETGTQCSATEGATFSNLRSRIYNGGSGTNNFQFRVNSADGNQLATGTGAADYEDAVNTDALSAGDLFNIAYTDTGSNSDTSWFAGNVEFDSGYGCFHGSGFMLGVVFDVASETRFIGLFGMMPADGATTEANVAFKVRGYTTFEALQVRVNANSRTNDSVFKNRINGGDGSAVITFGAGVTGLIEDTGLADAIGDGQTIGASIALLTGVEDISVCFVGATLKSTDTQQDIAFHNTTARSASATATYFPIGGNGLESPTLTDAQVRCKVGYAGTASNLRCYLSANTYGGAGTLKLMQNGSAVITLTLGAGGGAAWYENTSDSVTFDADDEFSYEFDEGTSGSITIEMVGMTLAPTTANVESTDLDTDGAAVGTLASASRASVALSSTAAAVGTLATAATITADLTATAAAVGTLDTASSVTTDLAAVGAAVGTLEAVDGTTVTTTDLATSGAATGVLTTEATIATALASDGVAVGTLEAFADQGFVTTDLSTAGSSTAVLAPASINAAALVLAGAGVGTLHTRLDENPYLRWGSEAARRRRELEDDDEEILQMVALLAPRLFGGRGARL